MAAMISGPRLFGIRFPAKAAQTQHGFVEVRDRMSWRFEIVGIAPLPDANFFFFCMESTVADNERGRRCTSIGVPHPAHSSTYLLLARNSQRWGRWWSGVKQFSCSVGCGL